VKRRANRWQSSPQRATAINASFANQKYTNVAVFGTGTLDAKKQPKVLF
jgi:hypothetical protein